VASKILEAATKGDTSPDRLKRIGRDALHEAPTMWCGERGVKFRVTVLKILVSYPDGFANLPTTLPKLSEAKIGSQITMLHSVDDATLRSSRGTNSWPSTASKLTLGPEEITRLSSAYEGALGTIGVQDETIPSPN
jgi:hypothetical protein